ncbi:MAG: DNA (cytosine-5-)-methyltransferase [Candidatus Onthovivens sp.]|nr:DNA (cytosine-5-)-methyltransferase [Candidatus Onthovivens sp.]
MGERQMNLWEFIYPMKRITKSIRLIELFAGIGSQFKALKVLTKNVESYKICEWAYNSYCSYNAIHIKDYKDYSNGLTKEQLIEKVKGTSLNYNEPLTDKQLASKPLEWLKNAYNNIVATHNLVNIMEIHGKDLEIVDTDKYEYIMTYSFPCQDLSLAGKRLGMGVSQKDGGTRSGLLWEVERILYELENKPQILLMENVPEVIGEKNIDDFHKWESKLEQLGYKNYVEILNAKDYGIPQNRKRCFMVSVLGEYAYNFPIKFKREYRLKDLLEKTVDKKYYLTDKHIERISNWKAQQKPLESMKNNVLISPTITARGAGEEHSGMVLIDTKLFDEKGIGIPIVEATKKGYKVAHDGDGVDIGGRMKTHRGTVQNGLAQTIKTDCDIGVVVQDEKPNIIGSYQPNSFCAGQIIDTNGIAPTFLENHGSVMGVIEKDDTKRYKNYITWKNKKGEFNTQCNRAMLENDLSLTIPTGNTPKVAENEHLRIRKLTPLECMRLMGFGNQDYKAIREINMSDMAIYHMAGDSIVVCVLIAIFYPLLFNDNNYKEIIKNYIGNEIVEKEQENGTK